MDNIIIASERHTPRGLARLAAAAALLIVLLATPARAQEQTAGTFAREYTEEKPLIYEGVWDLWPYAFLNDNGEPEGYNVDLIRLVMKRLNIPYVIKLKSSEEAFNDLKSGKSDLTLALAVGYHDEYGLYGKNAVTLFTQSVVTPKSKPVEIKTFRDLGKPGLKVIVNHTSMCYHLMKDYGWEENAIPEKDIREVIQRVSAKEEGQIVWNTLTLKWLMHRYLIDNLQLTPVNMPHGEYKFMSHDQHLLDLLDEELVKMNATDELKPLQDKWFYPERLQNRDVTPRWMIYTSIAAGIVLLIALVYLVSYRLQNSKLTRINRRKNQRLSLVLQTSQVRMWTYDIKSHEFAWRNESGQVACTYSTEEFSQRYSAADFAKLKEALEKLSTSKDPTTVITLNLRAQDPDDGQDRLRDYVIVLSVLRRDKNGRPAVIIGTKKDVTQERSRQRAEEERTLRYWSIFHTPVVGIMFFDSKGRLTKINQKACDIYQCEEDMILAERPHLSDFVDIGELSLQDTNGYHASMALDSDSTASGRHKVRSIHRTGNRNLKFRLMTTNDDNGQFQGVFAIIHDVSETVKGIAQCQVEQHRLDEVRSVLRQYNADIDNVLHESDLRLATYSPATHTLTIHRSVGTVQHAMTQARCMTLVDDSSKRLAMRMLNEMDNCEENDVKADIITTLRIKGRKQLALQFRMMPLYDKHGQVVEYLGLLCDISELRNIRKQLEIQTAKVQEVEHAKNQFVKNMIQEIRTPMDTVVNYVERFNPDGPTPEESTLCEGILSNADYLLHLIDNILYLSRLQAKMVEINRRPCNFAEIFKDQCETGWMKFQNESTHYIVENPYEQLVVDIDAENLGQVIRQVTSNAAQHTKRGVVKARYDYIGRRLVISIDDTGEGMSPELTARLNDKQSASQDTKGLGLAITKELIEQMGGTVEISSELGSGTTVYIMLPCHASAIKRKKLL